MVPSLGQTFKYSRAYRPLHSAIMLAPALEAASLAITNRPKVHLNLHLVQCPCTLSLSVSHVANGILNTP